MPTKKNGTPCWIRCGRTAIKDMLYCRKCWKAKRDGTMEKGNTSVYHLPGNP